eukprot:4319150-Pleurochrysis_carterae.AAC.1
MHTRFPAYPSDSAKNRCKVPSRVKSMSIVTWLVTRHAFVKCSGAWYWYFVSVVSAVTIGLNLYFENTLGDGPAALRDFLKLNVNIESKLIVLARKTNRT